MDGLIYGKLDAVPRLKIFNCTHADCGATFTREWRMKEHETVHTGERPLECPVSGCGRRFTRKCHLSRHKLSHTGDKKFRCTYVSCTRSFYSSDHLKRHVRYAHGDKDMYFKCHYSGCTLTFRKRRAYKMHLGGHGIPFSFKCTNQGCGATFETHVARRAHERTHTGYRCPQPDCQVVEYTWGKMSKHVLQHPVSYTCTQCQKVLRKKDALRRHRRTHALQKPVLLCPNPGCQAYFTTTFNLQHHIRKVHLQLLKYTCSYADCTCTFAMRESLTRHMIRHDPFSVKVKKRQRSSKLWQKRLEGRNQLPLVEDNLSRLFTLRMRLPRRGKVEANLSSLFNERKIPRSVDPEVNLRDLFSLKQTRPPMSEPQVSTPC